MIRFRRLAVLLVPLAVGLVSFVLPGRAQTELSSRFAFADTTLLRDTLGLDFSRLFPVADSLGTTPDSLRAVMIRYRLPIHRVVFIADSLGIPVDSVASTLYRERFNPLAAGARGRTRNDLNYSSTYNVGQTNSSWTNGADYNYNVGSLFLRNNTNITMDRYRAGGKTSLRQTRSAITESGWRFSPQVSVGGRVNLDRFDTRDPGATDNEGETKNEFQISTRTRQTIRRNLTSELNLFTGVLDLRNSSQLKRGLSGDLSGRVRLNSAWFSHDLNGQLTGNLARTRLPTSVEDLRTADLSNNFRGTLTAFTASPASLNLNYQFRRTRVETPSTSGIQRILTRTNGADGTIRLRQGNDRYLNITGRLGTSSQSTGSRDDRGANWQGRYGFRGWALDAGYKDDRGTSRFLPRGTAGGYNEYSLQRTSDVTMSKAFSPKITGKLNGSIGLSQYRYLATMPQANLPIDRDSYRQSYRIESLYNRSENLNTGLALEVSLTSAINIPARATSSNSDTRSYRAEWRWNYRLLPGLTVNQMNTLSADYRFYTFTPERDELSLDYSTLTTLSAVVTPRLSLDVTHNGRFQPKGNYGPLLDGRDYFKPADESQNYVLRSRVTYSPTPAFSFTISPEYSAVNRNGTVGGAEVPQRQTRQLNLSGGANLNIRLGRNGQLTGNISRNYQASRVTSFTNGVPSESPRSETDFWNGSLQLSWQP